MSRWQHRPPRRPLVVGSAREWHRVALSVIGSRMAKKRRVLKPVLTPMRATGEHRSATWRLSLGMTVGAFVRLVPS